MGRLHEVLPCTLHHYQFEDTDQSVERWYCLLMSLLFDCSDQQAQVEGVVLLGCLHCYAQRCIVDHLYLIKTEKKNHYLVK